MTEQVIGSINARVVDASLVLCFELCVVRVKWVMAMVAVPKYHQLLWPTLRALKAMGGSAGIDELLGKVIEVAGISEEVQKVPHTDGRRTELEYRLAWARTYLKRVGAVDNSTRGVWSITNKGETLKESDMAKIPAMAHRIKRELDDVATGSKGSRKADEDVSSYDSGWKDSLLSTLVALKADAFERLTQRILREAGFIRVEVTGRSGDGGIDGIGVLRVNLLSFQVLFQCKKYKGSIGAGAIRDFRGAMIGRCDKGLFVTTGSFTADARKEATRDGAPAIDLIDGDHLCDLLKQLKLGVATEQVEKMSVDAEWFSKI